MRRESQYGPLDRLLHRIAFAAGPGQRMLADVEASLFGDELEAVALRDPVWITALPRAGTTILLELLWRTGSFASHTYEDVPFVLAPLLWNRYSRRFRVEDEPAERAHGDGIEISTRSPEAFEEMVWKAFWPDHYRSDRILPWRAGERSAEFDAFLGRHARKVVLLRRTEEDSELRYLSKANLHVARLASRPGPLEEGLFLVPFREPLQQAASLLRQHRRFLEIHREDPFVRRYMSGIGHHEFGRDLRPVDFEGWLADAPSPEALEFWVRYWVVTYRHVLEHVGPGVVLISYGRLVSEPEEALGVLAGEIDLPPEALTPFADRLHPPRRHEIGAGSVPAPLRSEAEALFAELRERAQV